MFTGTLRLFAKIVESITAVMTLGRGKTLRHRARRSGMILGRATSRQSNHKWDCNSRKKECNKKFTNLDHGRISFAINAKVM